jgi:hypothetical protein
MADPWAVLGLGPSSSLDQARAARRRLAKELHPDLHSGRPAAERAELARRMTQVNLAVAELEAAVPVERRGSDPGGAGGAGRAPGAGQAGTGGPVSPAPGPRTRPRGPEGDRPRPAATAVDSDSFALDALPVEAFEAVFLAGYALGEVLVADEPYALELYLPGPAPCFCQLSLVPEAGGSMVSLDLAPAEGVDPPDVPAVRDLLVSELNDLAGSPRP